MSDEEKIAKGLARLALASPIVCSEPAAKPPPSVFDRMMTIVVGNERFQMHRGLLCFHSRYFKALLDGPFKEGGSNVHTLTTVSRNIFSMFYNWAYTGLVMNTSNVADADLSCSEIIYIYAFADFHMVPQLKDRAVELYFLKDTKTWAVNLCNTHELYEKTSESSLLRTLHVDLLIEAYNFNDWRTNSKDMPNEFIADLFESCRERKIVPGSLSALEKGTTSYLKKKRTSFCEKYHEHGYPEAPTSVESISRTFTPDGVACTCCGEEGHILDICPRLRARGTITCYNCAREGHIARNCPEQKDWSKAKCRNCDETGHIVARCPKKASPNRATWVDPATTRADDWRQPATTGASGWGEPTTSEAGDWGEPIGPSATGWGGAAETRGDAW
ncbi:hypothetical protein HBI04_060910 [Parastagonospora nodorum]|nr:hypothetical protein HBI03_053260 [Parastagonospora nodorum]KAH4280453.1 hypothetical protein HBI04_060910 [Parastagonospora nodorum]KAH5292031.1 hypothetical protein HBI11_192650 [Parastagonospora nodorum]KAH5996269.1 hypothetical protein HBI82_174080 [Parastagonospora nodorum]